MRVLGVDPGLGGGLALLDHDAGLLVTADLPIVKTDKSKQLSEAVLTRMVSGWAPDVAWVELVHSMPKQGVASTFTFGLTYGLIRGVLAGLQVPTMLVRPQIWKKLFQLGADKRECRITAARVFPLNVSDFARVRDDGRAEAALIALFGATQQLKI